MKITIVNLQGRFCAAKVIIIIQFMKFLFDYFVIFIFFVPLHPVLRILMNKY